MKIISFDKGYFIVSTLCLVSQTRVTDGYSLSIKEAPWQIILRIGGEYLCGGSILSPTHVLTAKHCVNGVRPSSVQVVAGVSCKSEVISDNVYSVSQIILHPTYDVALLILSRPIIFDSKKRSINFGDASDPENYRQGNPVRITGWGWQTPKGRDNAECLQAVDVQLTTNEIASRMLATHGIHGLSEWECATSGVGAVRKGACHGDSGGALSYWSEKYQKHILLGVVSWGTRNCVGNNTNSPSVYVRVGSLVHWLSQYVPPIITSLTGPSLICDQATYTMTNFPENRRVHWQASNDKVRLVSGQGTSSAVFARNAEQNGEVTISVYVDDVEVASQKVWVGVPVIRIQKENFIHERGDMRYYLCLNSVGTMSNSFWIQADGLDANESWEYKKMTQFNLRTTGNTAFFHDYNEEGVIFKARVRNACGWSEWHIYHFPVLVCEGESPTPRRVPPVYDRDDKSIYVLQPVGTREDKTSATTTMRSVRSVSATTDMGYEVQIWDKNNKLVRSVKSSSAYLRIPFADYPKGLYVVRIIHNGEATSHKIWVP